MIENPEIPVADMRQESFFLRFYLEWFIMDERFFMIDWEKGKHDDITGNRNI